MSYECRILTPIRLHYKGRDSNAQTMVVTLPLKGIENRKSSMGTLKFTQGFKMGWICLGKIHSLSMTANISPGFSV